MDGRDSVLAGARNFSLHCVQSGTGAHPDAYPMGARGSFPRGVNLTTPPNSVEVKNDGATPPYVLMVWCLTN
jgi:hypothetical protein